MNCSLFSVLLLCYCCYPCVWLSAACHTQSCFSSFFYLMLAIEWIVFFYRNTFFLVPLSSICKNVSYRMIENGQSHQLAANDRAIENISYNKKRIPIRSISHSVFVFQQQCVESPSASSLAQKLLAPKHQTPYTNVLFPLLF